jgi:mediator of replication checkpoint protein 1
MERNMQLAHQAKTKKKFNMQDLVSRLNPIQEIVTIEAAATSYVTASSDVEGPHDHDTPPTSPPSHDEQTPKDVALMNDATAITDFDADEELPALHEILTRPKRLDKGKGRAKDSLHIPLNPLVVQVAKPITAKKVRVVLPKQLSFEEIDLDSDDGIEITQPKSRYPVFERMPKEQNKDSRALITQRVLANLSSPGKRGRKGCVSINPAGLQASLQLLARQQALKERHDRLAELKAQGKVFQSEEEIEREQLQMDTLLEKAREMDAKLAKKEKEAAKKDGKGGDALDSDDDDDEDWEGSGIEEAGNEDAEDQVEEELELSGSEDEEVVADEESEGSEDEAEGQEKEKDAEVADLIDREAGENDESEQEDFNEADGEASDDEAISAPRRQRTKKRSRHVIVEDDEDSDGDSQQKAVPSQATQDDAMAAFGFNMDNSTSLGLTQMFAGTMANLKSQTQLNEIIDQDTQEDSLDIFRALPLTQPSFDISMPDASPDLLFPDSQVVADSEADPSAGQHPFDSQTRPSDTQFSEVPEPTQDAGFELSRAPAGLVAPASTIDTVIMPVPESPILKKKGKLHRRAPAVAELSDVDEDIAADAPGADAFKVMKKAAKKSALVQEFNKKNSEAKKMFEEQAEESEDEYAGLGGQSDDESGGEQDEEVTKMIDHGEVDVDERKIAAYFA